MVLYHADGTVVKAQEEHLEDEEQKFASVQLFTPQNNIADKRDRAAHEVKDTRVRIVVDPQTYYELYYSMYTSLVGEQLVPHVEEEWKSTAAGLDRRTLMKCSSTAYDFFTFEPEAKELHLPVCYPRKHMDLGFEKQTEKYAEIQVNWEGHINTTDLAYINQPDDQLAWIRHDEITNYLIPWLTTMEEALKKKEQPLHEYPKFDIPPTMLEKIHLYNVMLQMGIPRFFQQPLIDDLILQMYKTNLKQCHLSTLELTVGRFYSRGIAILDPVMNHFIGTYAFRSPEDRGDAEPLDEDKDGVLIPLPREKDTRKNVEQQFYLTHRPARTWLTYQDERPGRGGEYDSDTVLHPPKLEVIGHCLRNWSGVRRSGSTAAAHTGYPLNVGRVKKFYRRRATSPIRNQNSRERIDVADYSTYRLHNLEYKGRAVDFNYFSTNRPGNAAAPIPWYSPAAAPANRNPPPADRNHPPAGSNPPPANNTPAPASFVPPPDPNDATG